jgi:hypothetical protein
MVGFGAIRGGQFLFYSLFFICPEHFDPYNFSDLSYVHLGERISFYSIPW